MIGQLCALRILDNGSKDQRALTSSEKGDQR